MKKTIMCVAALIVAAIVSATVVSCKKDKDEVVTKATNSDAQALLNRIEAFQTLRDAVNSGAKADGSMTVEEMRQALDLVSNYEHSEHMTYCLNTTLDTLHVAMPAVDGEGYVSNADVVATYNAFETALEKCMLGVNDGMNVPSYFSIVMPKTGAKDDDDINIVFVRGEVDTNYNDIRDPYGEDDNYKWGLSYGLCDPIGPFNSTTDAAKELSRRLVFRPGSGHEGQSYIPYNVEHVVYTAMNCYSSNVQELENAIVYEDQNMEDCADTWLYWQSGEFEVEPCIYYDEMNCYNRGFDRNFLRPNAPLSHGPETNSPYHECSIHSYHLWGPGTAKRSVRMHAAFVVYCHITWSEPILPPVH